MTIEEKKLELVKSLNSHTYSSIYKNSKSKSPAIIRNKDEFIYCIEQELPITNPCYSINDITKIRNSKIQSEYIVDGVTYTEEKDAYITYIEKYCKLIPRKKFHFDDNWYSYKYSAEQPEYSFGIIEVENMPYLSFENKNNKKSFLTTVQEAINSSFCLPFMLFIDNKFVNWNNINIVFDSGNTYLLIYGAEYNWYDIFYGNDPNKRPDIDMIVLPYNTKFYGKSKNSHFYMMYNILKQYLNDKAKIENGLFSTTIPGVEDVYKYNGMVYNIGAWLYEQILNNYLEILTEDQIYALKHIDIAKIYNSNNIENRIITKFNVLDKDSYDKEIYKRITYVDKNIYETSISNIKFDDNGIIDDYGKNIIIFDDNSVDIESYKSNDKSVTFMPTYDSILFRNNYLVFNNGKYYSDYGSLLGINNIINIDNIEENEIRIFVFKPKYLEDSNNISYNFFKEYIYQNIKRIKLNENLDENNPLENEDFINFLISNQRYLDYSYSNKLSTIDNYNNAYESILNYDIRLINKIYHTNIESFIYTGEDANKNLLWQYSYESRRGLKIPRNLYKNYESYVLIFEDGELLEEYSSMIVYSNFFFIPMEREFNNNSEIELLYFNNINNNEIHFTITEQDIANHVLDENSENRNDIINQFTNNDDIKLFDKFIKNNELKIFCEYPEDIIIYKSLVTPNIHNAFNITYRDNGKLYLINELPFIENISLALDQKFTAVSSRKFIYQRLYVHSKSYRIELDDRFKYCDEQRQYILFINGRRMDDDTFIVTIPKYTRPFWGRYLYTAKFVSPNDRIEIFYVPDKLVNENQREHQIYFNEDGYIKTNRKNLSIPFDNRLYMVFINGKKIPSKDLISVDSSTFRVKKDTKSLFNLLVNNISSEYSEDVKEYMHDSTKFTFYDSFINKIMNNNLYMEYELLDKLFATYIKMSNLESPKSKPNVAKIAIINEVIRDFWVSSGFPYNEEPFVYDFEKDQFYINSEENMNDLSKYNLITPAMDASQIINIKKDDFHLLLFLSNYDNYIEKGRILSNFSLRWEYANNIYNYHDLIIKNQSISYNNIMVTVNNDLREWQCPDQISDNTTFTFNASSNYQTIQIKHNLYFCNGVYYGIIDEAAIKKVKSYFDIQDDITSFGLIPFSNNITTSSESQEIETEEETLERYKDNNTITKMDISVNSFLDSNEINDETLIDMSYSGNNQSSSNNQNNIESQEYSNINDFQYILPMLTKKIQDTPEICLDDYIIGNNKFFIYAAPKRLVLDSDNKPLIEFFISFPTEEYIQRRCRDDKTLAIFTDGNGWNEYTKHNLFNQLDGIEMIYLGEFNYKNQYDYEEPYCVWRTNGYFTRLFDDFIHHIRVRLIDGDYNR